MEEKNTRIKTMMIYVKNTNDTPVEISLFNAVKNIIKKHLYPEGVIILNPNLSEEEDSYEKTLIYSLTKEWQFDKIRIHYENFTEEDKQSLNLKLIYKDYFTNASYTCFFNRKLNKLEQEINGILEDWNLKGSIKSTSELLFKMPPNSGICIMFLVYN